MTQTLYNGAVVPTNSDDYALTEDLVKMCLSLNVPIPVATKAARDGLAALAPGGVLPVPTFAARTELPGVPLDVWDGVRWSTEDTAPVTVFATNFQSSGTRDGIPTGVPSVARTGRRVNMSGSVTNKIALSFAGGVEYLLGTIPTEYAPTKSEYFTVEVAFTLCRLYVRPDGEVRYMFATSIPSTGAGILHWSLSGIGWDK